MHGFGLVIRTKHVLLITRCPLRPRCVRLWEGRYSEPTQGKRTEELANATVSCIPLKRTGTNPSFRKSVCGQNATQQRRCIKGVSVTPRHAPLGFLPESASNPIEQFGRGRVCWHPGCDTRLSRYNDGEGCALHPAEPDVKRRLKLEQEWEAFRHHPDDAARSKNSRDGES
jgi:hypothetical protein